MLDFDVPVKSIKVRSLYRNFDGKSPLLKVRDKMDAVKEAE